MKGNATGAFHLEKPYVLGYHRCQYIDRFAKHPGVLKQGLLHEDGSSYQKLISHIREANAKAIRKFANIASSQNPPSWMLRR